MAAKRVSHVNEEIRVNMLRLRVLEFEKEVEEKIDALPKFETEILNIGKLRSQWLNSVSSMSQIDNRTFKKKLEVLRAQAELATIHNMLETTRMQGFYEAQTLADLISATRPLEEGETPESRAATIEATARNNCENLKGSLEQSMRFRANLSNYVCDMIRDADELVMEYDSQRQLAVDDLKRRISQYVSLLYEGRARSDKHNKDITGDYLVLRHNARVAREMLVRTQNEAAETRLNYQERLEKVAREATDQREKMRLASEAELRILTDEIREEVVRKEQELEEIRTCIVDRRQAKKAKLSGLKRQVKVYKRRYDGLQVERRENLQKVGGELTRLREMIDHVETKLFMQAQGVVMFADDAGGDGGDDEDGPLLEELGIKLENLVMDNPRPNTR